MVVVMLAGREQTGDGHLLRGGRGGGDGDVADAVGGCGA